MSPLKQSRGPSTSPAAIVNHPTRSKCWHAIAERPYSPAELARKFKVPVHDTNYHTKVLVEIGAAEKVGERQVRGATESFYRAIKRPEVTESEIADMDAADAIANATLVTQMSFADVALSLDSGKLVKRSDHSVVRFPMVIDEKGWADLSAAYKDLLKLFYNVQAQSAERMASDPNRQPIDVTALAFLFEKPSSKT
jgi:hypothetical protein